MQFFSFHFANFVFLVYLCCMVLNA